jgi:prolipoprotein diacylglyceryltransferase
MNSLHVFSLILGIGASFGLLWVMVSTPTAQRLHWLLAAWLTLIGALIGARAGFVLEHLPYFSARAIEMPQFWLGGLTWEGALAGGMLTLPLIARLWQWPLTLVSDRLSRLVLPLGLAGWTACWWSGLGYGQALQDNFWWGMKVSDESGVFSLRTPVQPLAILSLAVFLGVLELWLSLRDRPGRRGLGTLLVFSTDMLLFSLLRADPSPSLFGLRIETWLAMVYTSLGILFTIIRSLKNKKNPLIRLRLPGKQKKAYPYETESRPGAN